MTGRGSSDEMREGDPCRETRCLPRLFLPISCLSPLHVIAEKRKAQDCVKRQLEYADDNWLEYSVERDGLLPISLDEKLRIGDSGFLFRRSCTRISYGSANYGSLL